MVRTHRFVSRAARSARPWILVAPIVLGAALAAGSAIAGKGNDMPQPADAAKGASAASAANAADTALASVQAVKIDQPTVAVRLPVAGAGQPALRQALKAPTGRARVELVLDDITVAKPPGVLFNVYLATTGKAPRREYVGTLSFFGVRYGAGPTAIPRRKLEVARELKALQGGSPEIPDLQVVFEATEGDARSAPPAARASFDRAAGLEVGSIRLLIQ